MIVNKHSVTTGFRIPRGAFVIGMGVAALLISGCADGLGEEFSVSDLEGTWIQSGKGFEQGQSITWDNQKIALRIPALSCGVVGWKPSRGLVPAGTPTPFLKWMWWGSPRITACGQVL